MAEIDDATAFRLFLLSFFDTDFTFGRSLIAVVGDTSDGAIGEDVTVVMLAFGNKFVIFDELVKLAVVGVTKQIECHIYFVFFKINFIEKEKIVIGMLWYTIC